MKKKTALISLCDVNNLGIRTLFSVLDKAEIDVDLLFFKKGNMNSTMAKPTEREIDFLVEFIKNKKYEIVGIGTRSSIFSLAKEIGIRLNKLEKKPLVVFGGVQATLDPEKSLKYCDAVCVGEGEKTILDICNGKQLKDIQNIWYNKNGKIIKNRVGLIERNLDSLPFPDFLDKNKYYFSGENVIKLNVQQYKTGYTSMTSRGCPFNCTYCCNHILRKIYDAPYLRRRSVGNVIEELKQAKENFPSLLSISFADDVFTYDKHWLKEFVIRYKKEINLPFFCYVHPKMCGENEIRLLRWAGLSDAIIGVQSFSEKTKKLFNRSGENEEIVEAIKNLKKYKVPTTIDIIMDNPMETEEDLKETLDWLLKIPAPFNLNTHTLTHFPKTELTEKFVREGLIGEDHIEDELEQGWTRWSPSLDLRRDKLNLFYDCLYYLTKLRFRNKKLIMKIQRSKYFREHPEKLAKIIKPFSFDVLSLDWNSKTDRVKYLIYRGLKEIKDKGFKSLYLKIKRQRNTPDIF